MELQLQKKTYSCYESAAPLCENREMAAETIVPDYCPDIARIIDASGCLMIRSKEMTDGRIGVSGAVKMTLLYTPEGNGGIKSFEYTIPLEESFELRALGSDLRLEAQLGVPEVRAINPRKILTRATVAFCLTPYQKGELTTCGGIEEPEAYGIHTLCEEQDICIIKSVKEKDFTFTENIAISPTKEGAREILCTKTQLRATDVKAMGGKVLVKGVVCAEILYCALNGELCQENVELPFSQIMDGVADDGELSAEAYLRLTGSEWRIGSESAPDDARTIGVKLFLSAFIVLRQTLRAYTVSDLYSTSHDLTPEMKRSELCRESSRFVKEHSVREQIETGTEAAAVLSSEVLFTQASVSMQDGNAMLRASAVVKVIYLDEGGVPFSCERRCEINTQMPLPKGCTPTIEDICCAERHAMPLGSGIEMRFTVLFTVSAACYCRCDSLHTLQAKPREEDCASMPSLVLKPLLSGQRLWDIAKQHRTTVEDILSANELESAGDAVVGEVLLIPRRR